MERVGIMERVRIMERREDNGEGGGMERVGEWETVG